MHAAVRAARTRAREVIVAAPVASWQSIARLEEDADDVVVVHVPRPFRSVGTHYDDFSQVTDDEVRALLGR